MTLDEKTIVGIYEAAKVKSFIDGKFEFHTRDEVKADLEKKLAAGEIEEDELNDGLQGFDSLFEFTADHIVNNLMPVPDGVSEEELREAVESGEVAGVKDGYIVLPANEWKAEDGRLYYNSGESRELFGDEQSPWDELTLDDEGLMDFGSGMFKLRKR